MRLTLALLVVALAISTGGATMAVDKGFGSKIKKVSSAPTWYQGKDKARGKGTTPTPTAPSAGWTEAAKKAYGGRYGEAEQRPNWLTAWAENLGAPQLGTGIGPAAYVTKQPGTAAMPLLAPSAPGATLQPRSAGMAGPNSFIGGGGAYVVGLGGQAVNLAERAKRIKEMSDAAQRRKDFFADYGMPADYDVGNIELGNWIGDYIRSLYTVPPPTAEPPTGGPTWWGGRGGGRGYGAGYNPMPSWFNTGLFQLNANR